MKKYKLTGQLEMMLQIEHANLILQEAAAYGLRAEVEMYAKKYINQGYKYIDAYHMAYAEWIK